MIYVIISWILCILTIITTFICQPLSKLFLGMQLGVLIGQILKYWKDNK